MGETMNLYETDYDGNHEVVEAASMAAAIRLWAQHQIDHFGSGWSLDDEPQSIRLITDGYVIRAKEVPPEQT